MKKILTALLASSILLISGCGVTMQGKKELELINDANYFFTDGKYDAAYRYYKSLLDKYPDSPYRIHAQLGVADSQYMQKEYLMSEAAYDRFIELYPLDNLTPHATFYRAMSYYQDIKEIPRDQTYSKNAMDIFIEFTEKYPKHPAVGFIMDKIVELDDRMAKKQIYLIDFYYGIDAFSACINRVDTFVAQYPKTKYVPKALLLKARSLLEEEAFTKSAAVYEDLIKHHPNTESGKLAKSELADLEKDHL